MGYQDTVGNVPTRGEEIQMIEKLQTSWKNQPYHKYYMNEDLRKNKMKLSEKLNKNRVQFLTNFLIYGLLFSPIVVLMRRFSILQNGLPRMFELNFFNKFRSNQEARARHNLYFGSGLWLFLTYAASQFNTDFYKAGGDENYFYLAKPQKML